MKKCLLSSISITPVFKDNNMNIPFVNLSREADYFLPLLLQKTEKVLKSGIYINGPNVKELEKKVAIYLNVKYVVSVGNGSDALTFILRSLNLSSSDEIICPANSFIATAWSIIASGAKPVFCDVDKNFLLDIDDFKKKVNNNTRAVIPVHLTGKVFPTEQILDFCSAKSIKIIEDAAQSFGAGKNNEYKTGAISDAAAFSLHPLKNFAIYGDGGLISTNDPEIADNCNLLRNHGLKNRDEAKIWGYNSRLDELQAAYALTKLAEIDNLNNRYIEIAKRYDNGISPIAKKPELRKEYKDVFHNYVILVPEIRRNSIMSNLYQKGIETKIHYPIPLHLQECSKNLNYKIGDIPRCEQYANSMISLPIYPTLSNEEVDYIIDTLNNELMSI
ncbi:pyridoxal-phosphate-dependent aminotransferase [Prochlorococcus marinus subsp. pastoris str. CCMP1986]|uniref:Pyridoxal-phosphate-dependent aminotransferase n=2 Tax=Prochlorococcaceae TaxID=2881426 RepID=Q7V0J7_PROMP|nr:DegT/DnrJ/EryC1/StrS family aminotransferase [Prochlorococcus marinus]CAE19718.1 pyridoxal-phosphate-dependent aminotransferase [Prochlorococcus marinus subsp. pastoris str. CCMP1986]